MQNPSIPVLSGPLHAAQLDVQEQDFLSVQQCGISEPNEAQSQAKNSTEPGPSAASSVKAVVEDALNWCS